MELQHLLSDKGDLTSFIPERPLRILGIVNEIEVRRQHTLEAISTQDDDVWSTLEEEVQVELERIQRILGNPEARGRYLPIVVGWKRVVSTVVVFVSFELEAVFVGYNFQFFARGARRYRDYLRPLDD